MPVMTCAMLLLPFWSGEADEERPRVAQVPLHRLLRALRVPLDDRVEHRRVLADDLVQPPLRETLPVVAAYPLNAIQQPEIHVHERLVADRLHDAQVHVLPRSPL